MNLRLETNSGVGIHKDPNMSACYSHSFPLAALPHGKCSRSLDQNPERKMFSSQCTHLLSWGAQLPNVSLNSLPEAEHSLELCQQEIALIMWDTHHAALCFSLTVPRDGLSPAWAQGEMIILIHNTVTKQESGLCRLTRDTGSVNRQDPSGDFTSRRWTAG